MLQVSGSQTPSKNQAMQTPEWHTRYITLITEQDMQSYELGLEQ